MVAASVTRMPSTKRVGMLSFSSKVPICGPPPCTTTGFMPTSFISAKSRAKVFFRVSSTMAAPPYFTTMVQPWKWRM